MAWRHQPSDSRSLAVPVLGRNQRSPGQGQRAQGSVLVWQEETPGPSFCRGGRLTAPRPAPSRDPSAPACSVPSAPQGQMARAAGWAGWAPAGARINSTGRAGRTRGWQRGRSGKERGGGGGGGPAGSFALPEPPLGTSLRALIVAWHKDAFQLPATLPQGRGLPGDSPGLATACNACTSWARRVPAPGRHRAQQIPSDSQLLPLAPRGTGRSSAPAELLQRPPDPPPLLQLAPLRSGRWAHSQPATMNVFDRNINLDGLFKFSHM